MQQQPDKEFDAMLREKMQGFSAEPPAAFWGTIEKEVKRPAGKKRGMVFSWLKIAASVCLLALAGIWAYNYEAPIKEDIVASEIPGNDSLAEKTKPKVTIFNRSRVRDAAGQETKNDEAAEIEGQTEEQAEEEREQPEVNPSPAPEKETIQPETIASLPGSGKQRTARPVRGNEVPANAVSAAASPVDVTTADASSGISNEPELNDEQESATDLELQTIAQVNPGQADTDPEITFVESPSLGLVAESSPEPVTGAGKNSLLPKEIRELSGVGEALNLVASTIDKSEDKFIQVGKDERSGKWNGLSLDLGIVTISYNKPEKKKND